jgi:hypothetical protein
MLKLIGATNFFVVLPSIVITLNPRDWRAGRANKLHRTSMYDFSPPEKKMF